MKNTGGGELSWVCLFVWVGGDFWWVFFSVVVVSFFFCLFVLLLCKRQALWGKISERYLWICSSLILSALTWVQMLIVECKGLIFSHVAV